MKISRKYATIAFLLIAMSTIVPVHTNASINEYQAKQEVAIELEKTKTPSYISEELGDILAIMATIAFCAMYFYGVHLYVSLKNARGMTKGGKIVSR